LSPDASGSTVEVVGVAVDAPVFFFFLACIFNRFAFLASITLRFVANERVVIVVVVLVVVVVRVVDGLDVDADGVVVLIFLLMIADDDDGMDAVATELIARPVRTAATAVDCWYRPAEIIDKRARFLDMPAIEDVIEDAMVE